MDKVDARIEQPFPYSDDGINVVHLKPSEMVVPIRADLFLGLKAAGYVVEAAPPPPEPPPPEPAAPPAVAQPRPGPKAPRT